MGGFDPVQTEDVFREANEHIAEKARKLELQQPIPFLCECSDKRCFAHLFLDPEEYEEARSDPRRYLTIAGIVGRPPVLRHGTTITGASCMCAPRCRAAASANLPSALRRSAIWEKGSISRGNSRCAVSRTFAASSSWRSRRN